MDLYLYKDLYDLEETHWWHQNKRAVVLWLLRRYLSCSHPKLIDIGCGTGKNVEVFSRLGETWGLDMSRRALAFCKKRGLRHLTHGTAERTGLRKTFDAVTLLDVLEHTDDKKTLREMKRILKPHGILIITVPAYTWMWTRWDEVLHHKRRYTAQTLRALLQSEGFTIRNISYLYAFLLLPAYFIRYLKRFTHATDYGSDFQINSPVINTCMSIVCTVERWWLTFASLPFGTSIVCVATRG